MNETKKVLIQYKRGSRRRPKAVIVAIGAGILGWSICDKTDTFNKEIARGLAIERAKKMAELPSDQRIASYNNFPAGFGSLTELMLKRSYLYFKQGC